jgi:hypothetical protein
MRPTLHAAFAIAALVCSGCEGRAAPHREIHLDAEELAELGMAGVYQTVQPGMRARGVTPEPLSEEVDEETVRYAVSFRGRTYPILSGGDDLDSFDARARATVVFFQIINAQMEGTLYRFYALRADNDLAGTFLTEEEYRSAAARGPREERPYIPVLVPPWFGQQHD